MEPKSEIKKTESPLANAAALVAANGNMEVGKLKELLELQERWDATQAKKAYVVAMSAFKANPPEIFKDKTVKYKEVKYSHSSLHNVTSCINKALSEHGLTASWVTSQDNGSVKVTCKITHIMGHSEETSLSAPPDNTGSKNVIQAIGSTVTYLQRYTLLALTGLATHDQDDDGATLGKNDTLPAKPTADEDKILTNICTAIKAQTKKTADKSKVAAIFLSETGKYPQNPRRAKEAAQWVVSNHKEGEWTKQTDMKELTKILDQAFFEFETEHQSYLADNDGKVEFNQNMFIKAVTKAFGTLPIDKTVKEIVEAVKPENVAVTVEEK